MADFMQWQYAHLEANTANLGGLVDKMNRASQRGWEVADIAFADKTLGMNSIVALLRRPLAHPDDPADPGPGWKGDPTSLAEQRYWDGRLWTAHVRGPAYEEAAAEPPDPADKEAWRSYLGTNATNRCKSGEHTTCNRDWCSCTCHRLGAGSA